MGARWPVAGGTGTSAYQAVRKDRSARDVLRTYPHSHLAGQRLPQHKRIRVVDSAAVGPVSGVNDHDQSVRPVREGDTITMHDLGVRAGGVHRRPIRDNRPFLVHRQSVGARIE